MGGDLSDSWRKEATDRLLAVGPGVIGVGTVRNMDVPVVVEIADAEPAHDRKAWNQVNECSVEASSWLVARIISPMPLGLR